jgi:hypothetical protein
MKIDKMLRNTLFNVVGTNIYYTIDIDSPYKTDSGKTAYFINNSYTAFEYRANLIDAIKGRNKALKSITLIYKE